MEQFFSRPEVQSAVVPFLVALASTLGLRKFITRAWIWALLAAFMLSAGLINGITVTPLTGTRKIILLVLASMACAALLPAVLRNNLQRAAVILLSGLGLAWVFWTVTARMEISAIAMFIFGAIALVLLLSYSFDRIAKNPAQLHGAGLGLLLGVGLCATAGASALLGQLALAISAASGGVFLGWILKGNSDPAGNGNQSLITLPYVIAPALLGLAAVVFARLPWYALIPLALIPVVTRFVPVRSGSRFLNALLCSLPGLLIAVAIAFWVWQSGSSESGY